MNRTSARLAAIAESATLAVDAKAKALQAKGENVIGFGAGEPDFPTPENIVEAAVRACRDPKMHKYTPAAGLPALREAIAAKTLRDSGFSCQASQVLVTNGGKHAVFTAFAALCDPGDEVICPAPYWTTYPEAITLAGGVPVVVQTDETTGFKVTVEQLEAALHAAHQGAAVRQPRQPQRRDLLARRGRGDRSLGRRQGRVGAHRRDLRAPRLRRQPVRQHAHRRARAGRPVRHRQRRRQDLRDDRLARRLDDRAERRDEGGDQLPVAQHLERHQRRPGRRARGRQRRPVGGGDDARGVLAPRRHHAPHAQRDPRRLGHRAAGRVLLLPEREGPARPAARPQRHGQRTTTLELADAILGEAKVAFVPGEAFGTPGYARFSFAMADADMEEGIRRIHQWVTAS